MIRILRANPLIRPLIRPLILPLVLSLVTTACAASRSQTARTANQTAACETRRTHADERFDSLAVRLRSLSASRTEANRTLLLTTEEVPGQTARLTIPMQELRNLPEGAKYTARNGRASVEAQRHGDSILLTGSADSIARRCIYFERQAFRQRRHIDSLDRLLAASQAAREQVTRQAAASAQTDTTAGKSRKSSATWYWWLLTGFLAGGAAAAWLKNRNPLKTFVSFIKNLV